MHPAGLRRIERQLEWLKKTLKETSATFKVICSNVPMAPNVKPGSKDTWDGYDTERQRIYQFIADQRISGVIIAGSVMIACVSERG